MDKKTMEIKETKFENIVQLEAMIAGLDTMEEIKVWTSPAGMFPVTEAESYKGIWNLNRNRLEAITTTKYNLVQHKDALMPLAQMFRGIGVDVKGKLTSNGGRVCLEAYPIGDNMKVEVAPNDWIDMGIKVINSVNSSTSLRFSVCGMRLVCTNGLIVPDGKIASIKRIHRGAIPDKDKLISEVYKEAFEKMMASSANFSRLVERAVKDEIIETMKDRLLMGAGFGSRQIKQILTKTKKFDIKNRWDLHNAITSWVRDLAISIQTRESLLGKANTVLQEDSDELLGQAMAIESTRNKNG